MIYLMTAFFLSFNNAGVVWWCGFGVIAAIEFAIWNDEVNLE